jgi:hypothetical protein
VCGLTAHSSGSGLRPCDAPGRSAARARGGAAHARSGTARVLDGGDFTDAGGSATRSEWQWLWSSPGRRGRGAALIRPATRRSVARLGGDLHRNGEGEAADNRSTRRREGGEHGGQSREKTVAQRAHPGGGGEARPGGDGGVARSDTCCRKRKGGGGFRHGLSGRRVRLGEGGVGQRLRASDTGCSV